MTECLGTDAMIAIGDALSWDVSEGLRHLQTCEECRAQLEALRLTRAAFVDSEPVDAAVLRRISAALSAAADTERKRSRVRRRWGQSAEAFLAGVTALIILVTNRVPIDGIGGAALGFALGATLMVCGGMLVRKMSAFGQGGAHA
jgi:anti-sigma factor RsiW